MTWSEAEAQLLQHLWNVDGLSAAACAERLSKRFKRDFSRSGVMGFITRNRAHFETRGSPGSATIGRPARLAAPPATHIDGYDATERATIGRLWRDGKATSEIALAVGRSVGSIHEFAKRHRDLCPRRSLGGVRPMPVSRDGASPRTGKVPIVPVEPLAVGLVDLKRGDCRYPVGAETGARQRFCGHPARDGSPYCERHHRLTHVELTDRAGDWREAAE